MHVSTNRPHFRPFNPRGPLRNYVRNLPHWRQPGATYFVTFRLIDSIPSRVLAIWHEERNHWLRVRGIRPEWETSDPRRFAEK